MKNVAIFFGGNSLEHDVSVITGVMTLNALKNSTFNPIPVYIDKEGKWWSGQSLFDVENFKNLNLKSLSQVLLFCGCNTLFKIKKKKFIPLSEIAVALNCCHGGVGENGALSGFLECCNIPIASPSVLPSSIAMDKSVTKLLLKGLNIPHLKGITISSPLDVDECNGLSFPLIVKPVDGGSSIGIVKVEKKEGLKKAVSSALRYSTKVLIEPLLTDFTEINCALYKNAEGEVVVSPCERPLFSGDILSFSDKYLSGEREFPANIPEPLVRKIQGYAKKVYLALNFTGLIRIDFMVKEGLPFLNEINSVPGSLSYYFFSDTLKGFRDILLDLIALAEKNFAVNSSVIKKFNSSILNITGVKSTKRL